MQKREVQIPKIKQTKMLEEPGDNIVLKRGEVYMVRTDNMGEEILGTGSVTSLKTFNQSFAHLNFKIKKKG